MLLLTLTSGDEQRDQRDLAELEGLVRSAGAEPVARTSQRVETGQGSRVRPGELHRPLGRVQSAASAEERYQERPRRRGDLSAVLCERKGS